MTRWLAVLTGLVLALWALPLSAQPRRRVPRIAVGPVTGPMAGIARGVLAGALSDHAGEVQVVSVADYNAAADRLGVTERASDEAIASVGRSLNADDVVAGVVERRNQGLRFQVRVLRSRDGALQGRVSWELRGPDEVVSLRSEVWDQVGGYLRVDTATSVPSTPEVTPTASESASGACESREVQELPRTPGLGWLSLSLGGGLAGRAWRIPVLGESTARGYENGAYGELQGSVTALVRLSRQRLGIGAEARIAVPVGLSSQGRTPEGRTLALATSAFEGTFGPVFMVRPGSGGLLKVSVGVAFHTFNVDTERLAPEMRLAQMSYVGLRVAGEGSVPFVATPLWEFGMLFGGELRWAGISSEARERFGANPGDTFAVGAWAGLVARLDGAAPGLGLRATAELLRYRTAFAGPGRIGTGSDSVDDYTRFTLSLTYTFGTERVGATSGEGSGAGSGAGSGGGGAGQDPFASRRSGR